MDSMIPDVNMFYTQAEIQTNCFDKSHITSHHYDKVAIDSMIPDVSICYNKAESHHLFYILIVPASHQLTLHYDSI